MSDTANPWPTHKMTADEFIAWAETYEGDDRLELHDGYIVPKSTATAPEMLRHVELKAAFYNGLRESIKKAGLPCRAFVEGMAVRIDADKTFIPDVIVHCGEKLQRNIREIHDPVIVVEVLSPSTRKHDLREKLEGYFQVPGIMHYLIADPDKPLIIHYARQSDGSLRTTLSPPRGTIEIDPPGLLLDLEAVFAEG